MTVVAGPFFAAAGLLGAAGILKILRPASTVEALRAARLPATRSKDSRGDTLWVGRLLGSVELIIAVVALGLGGRATAALVATCYLGFSLFSARLLLAAEAGASCGCFGTDESPAAPTHVVVNAAIGAAVALAVAWPTSGIGHVLGHQPLAGLPFLTLTVVCGWLLFATLTVVPELQAAMADGRIGADQAGRRSDRSVER